jgi:hypothetical protein
MMRKHNWNHAFITAAAAAAFIWLAAPAVTFGGTLSFQSAGGSVTHVPEPRLLEPLKEVVNLTGKPSVEFEWDRTGDTTRRYRYDFRIYAGREMLAKDVLLKKALAPNVFKISVPSAIFRDQMVYTWSVRQVYKSGDKSRRAFHSFVVRKRSD